ncbi:MAG TPA: thioredoxin family protein [Polyangiaceae bacterium]|nr:thioredoxin family protein [Polyangiaceae bacterium]
MKTTHWLWLLAPLAAACSSPAGRAPAAGEGAAPATRPAEAATAAPKGGAPAAEAAKGPAALGQPAPDFALRDLDGQSVKLSDFRGKTVVLEWFNPECPFVKNNHAEGPLKDMAKKVAEKGVVWLAINSGAPGKQGHGVAVNREGKQRFGLAHPVLLDETGEVGKLYGATRTPHMYVIDPAGVLAYRGAIDNAPDGDPRGDRLINYVEAALADLSAGRPVATPEVKAYGCSVKYAN